MRDLSVFVGSWTLHSIAWRSSRAAGLTAHAFRLLARGLGSKRSFSSDRDILIVKEF